MGFSSLLDDVASAIRRIRRHPRNGLVLFFMLAVAVGSVIGIFDLAYEVVQGELPFRQPERIVVASTSKSSNFLVSPYDWQPNPLASTVFERIAEFHFETANLSSASGKRRLLVACVTPRFFSVLGVRMEHGSDFADPPPSPADSKIPWLPIVLSYNLWRNYFGSDEGIVGRSITLELLYPYRFQVIGVAPAGVAFPPDTDAWIPEHLTSSPIMQTASPPNWSRATVGLLRPGISLPAAEAAVRSWPRKDPMWIWNDAFHLVPLREFLVGKFYHLGPLLWLVTIFFLVLTAVAAVSIVGLEFQERDGEFAVRKMLGASPGRLFRSLNIEMAGILLSALAASLAVRYAVLRVTVGYLQLPFSVHSSATWRDLVMATSAVGTVAMWIAVAQGRALGVFGSRGELLRIFPHRENALRSVAGSRFPLQIVPATILLVTGVFLFRSAYAIQRIDPGVRTSGAFVCEVVLPYQWGEYVFGGIDRNLTKEERDRHVQMKSSHFHRQMDSYFSLIVQSIREHAGVTEAGVISLAPYRGYPTGNLNVYVSHEPQQSSNSKLLFPHMVSISSGAVRALGMRIIHGRNFSDNGAHDVDTVIINEAMAERLGPGTSALGQYIILGGPGLRPARIIGILQNVHETNLFAPVEPTAYFPFSQYGLPDVDIVFHTSRNMDSQQAHSLIGSSVRSVVPGAILLRFSNLEDMVWSAGRVTRYCAYFLLVLAVLGVCVAGICSWARIVTDARRRNHEIGIRLALGAKPWQLIRLLVGNQVKFSFLAASMGAVIAWWFSRLLSFLSYGVNASSASNYLFSLTAITTYVLLVSSWAVRGTVRRNPRDLISERSS